MSYELDVDEGLIVEVHPKRHSVRVRVVTRDIKVFGRRVGSAYLTTPLDDAVLRLTREGDWTLWITDRQVKSASIGDPKDFPRVGRFRKVPLDERWFREGGLSALDCGEDFALTRGDTDVGDAELMELLCTLALPQRLDAAIVFDLDVEFFDAVYTADLFDRALELLGHPLGDDGSA